MNATRKYIAIIFVAAILIQFGTFISIIFEQYTHSFHQINESPRGIPLENDPRKTTSNQSLSGLDNNKSTSWTDIFQAIGGIATAGALIVVVQTRLTQQQIQLTQEEMKRAQFGFLKLDLECSYKAKEGKKYIVSKTLIENTSSKPIKVAMAFLLIVGQYISFQDGYKQVYDEVMKDKKVIDRSTNLSLVTILSQIKEYFCKNKQLVLPNDQQH